MKPAVDPVLFEDLVAIRRDLHRHPELAWEETRTANCVCRFLDDLGIKHQRVAETGILADLPGNGAGPRIALRADMDALPIQEETGLAFSSVNEGCMHACGHDVHMGILLGAAAMLTREPALPAPVRLVFQPAEERGQGAIAMIGGGALEDVAMIFGGHVDRHYPVGTIVVTEGPVNASTDTFRIDIAGRSAHAARPHEGIDAVVVAMLIVTSIQTIVSREINPAHPSVVTVGRVNAGTAANVIAGRAVLEGTVRAQEPEVRAHLVGAVERIARSAGQLHGADVHFEIVASTPPVLNPPDQVALVRAAAIAIVGPDHVRPLEHANMGAEDFGEYMRRIPGCYVRYGSQVPGKEGFPAHSSRFDVDEQVLGIGAAYLHRIAMLAGEAVVNGQAGATLRSEIM
jgi:hippurate hydrolase